MLVFKPEEHLYLIDGLKVPSVTEILGEAGLRADYSAVSAGVLEKARRRGTAVHAICEAIDRGEDDPFFEPEYRGYAISYERFLQETGYKAEATEERVYHSQLYYAGTLDMRGLINGKRCVIDRKSSRVIDHHATPVQCAAYRGALLAQNPDESIDAILALHLRSDGIYQLHWYDCDESWAVFTAALRIYQHKHRPRK